MRLHGIQDLAECDSHGGIVELRDHVAIVDRNGKHRHAVLIGPGQLASAGMRRAGDDVNFGSGMPVQPTRHLFDHQRGTAVAARGVVDVGRDHAQIHRPALVRRALQPGQDLRARNRVGIVAPLRRPQRCLSDDAAAL